MRQAGGRGAQAAVVLGTVVALLLGSGGCARRGGFVQPAAGDPAWKPGLEVRAEAEVRAGSVNGSGFVQTPKGGQPGTTSIGRPTFDELGVDAAWAPAADLRLAWRRHRLHLGAQYWVLHGDEVLRQDLTTWDKTYTAGTSLTSGTEILAGSLAYGYAFDIGRRGQAVFTPSLGVFTYGLGYEVSGGGQTSTRDFTAFSPMLETDLAWYPGGRMHLSSQTRWVLDDLLGLSSPTTVYEASLRLHLDLWRDGNLFLGVGATHIEHRDEQTVPNDAELTVLPWFSLGGHFRF